MKLEQARILEHRDFRGGYRLLIVECQPIASAVKPGQFIHLRVPGLDGSVLRRPFSVYRADANSFCVLYKQVGRGTREMSLLPEGRTVSIIGPLGNGFPLPPENVLPVLVAGGYGVAPLYLLASRLTQTGVLFVGGRTADDILCTDAFEALGWDLHVTTEDGSLGMRGRVTDALDPWIIEKAWNKIPVFYACGPDGLLRAVDSRVVDGGWQGWLSLDKHMGCGVGACLACVQRVRAEGAESQWKRVCKDGPVFAAGEILWDYGVKDDNA
jgi:dihydroorotate dehydrogenase electron transfer subunit